MMAENGNEYDSFRESCVYISAEIQGSLERKKGVLGGKIKQWCSLQGSTLYLQKKHGDVMKTINLKDANHVQKITSEYTGTHFEIHVQKKNYVFICPSSENCTAWVKALQTAMGRKESSHVNSSASGDMFFIDDKCLYSEINEAVMSVHDGCNSDSTRVQLNTNIKICDYDEPWESGAIKMENDYWDLGDLRANIKDFRNSLYKSQPTKLIDDNNKNATSHITTGQIIAVNESVDKCSTDVISVDVVRKTGDNYSKVEKVTIISPAQDASQKVHTGSVSKNEKTSKDYISKETVSSSDADIISFRKKESHVRIHLKYPELEESQMQDLSQDDGSSLFEILSDALTDRSSPVQDYFHPLTEQDCKPVEELTEFLKNNHEICRVSYSCIAISSDPVSSLKSYLMTLESNNLLKNFK